MLIISRTRRWRTLQLFTVGILSLWIVSNILKGYSVDWSVSWWSAELVLLAGLIIGPAFLVQLFYEAMVRAEGNQQQATLYSDLLVHDISNIHQAVLVALELLDLNRDQAGVFEKILSDAQTSLRRADQLVRNVRNLGMIGQLGMGDLRPVDLVASIDVAFRQICIEMDIHDCEFSINKELGECFVTANDLLDDLFANLIRNAVKYSPDDKRIEVVIERIKIHDLDLWEIRHIDYGRGIPPDQRESLFQRFMNGAEGVGLGLSVVYALTQLFGGTIDVEGRDHQDYSMGTVFILNLPAASFLEDFST
jgi:signal transduction histidine kinase